MAVSRRRRIAELAHRGRSGLEQGDYGYCVTCGEPIAPQRLNWTGDHGVRQLRRTVAERP